MSAPKENIVSEVQEEVPVEKEEWEQLGFESNEAYQKAITTPAVADETPEQDTQELYDAAGEIDYTKKPEEQVAEGKTEVQPASKVSDLKEAVSSVKKSPVKGLDKVLPANNVVMPKVVTEALDETNNPKEVIEEVAKVDKKAAKNPLVFAQKYLGISETDPAQQKTIKGFFDKAVPGWIKDNKEVMSDARAWCAAFVNNILNEGQFPTLDYGNDNFNLVRARKYAGIGEPVPNINEAEPGDIVVVKDTKNNTGYHVAFYSGKKGDSHLMLGGNQDNQVNVKEIDTDSLQVVSVRRLKGIENIDNDTLQDITSTEFYSGKNKKTKLR